MYIATIAKMREKRILSCPNKEIKMSSSGSSTSSSYGMIMMRMARIMLTILKKLIVQMMWRSMHRCSFCQLKFLIVPPHPLSEC